MFSLPFWFGDSVLPTPPAQAAGIYWEPRLRHPPLSRGRGKEQVIPICQLGLATNTAEGKLVGFST